MNSTDMVRKKEVKNRHTLPMISLGTKQRKLLQYMFNNKEARFNLKDYSRISGIQRSSLYYLLDQLISKGLVYKPFIANYQLTNQGKVAAEVSTGVSSDSGRECRKSVSDKQMNLSTHYLKYRLEIKEKKNFNEERINELNPVRYKRVNLINLETFYIYFDNATIIIHPKTIFIRIHDILTEDVEEAELRGFNTALEYIIKLNKIGLQEACISLEQAHFARVKSFLSEFLKKVDDRYSLDLGKKKKFWIDNSGGSIEDETNDNLARERLDKSMKEIMTSDIELLDIQKMKEILGMLTKLETARVIDSDLLKKREIGPKERPGYIG